MFTRRRLLQGVGAGSGLALGGCVGGGDGNQSPSTSDAETMVGSAVDAPSSTRTSTPVAISGKWRMFQYDQANGGYSPDVRGPKEGVVKRWAADLGSGIRSSPAIWNNRVFVGAGRQCVALDLSDGRVHWSVEADGPVDASPTIADELVYFNSDPGTVYAVDAKSGEIRWQTATEHAIPPETPRTSSPTVTDGSVFVGLHRGGVWAFDSSEGGEQWRTEVSGAVIGAVPAVVDGRLYSGSTNGELVAMGTEDGDIAWRTPLADFVTCPPTVTDGLVYVGASDGNVYEVRAETGSIERTFETEFEPDLPGQPLRKINASPAIADDTLVVGSNDYHAYAWDLDSGERRWRFRVGGRSYTAPAIADGVVYLGGISGRMHGLDLTSGEQLWSYQATGELRDSSPAVLNNGLCFGDSSGHLYLLAADRS